jgi:hypothetical protein
VFPFAGQLLVGDHALWMGHHILLLVGQVLVSLLLKT